MYGFCRITDLGISYFNFSSKNYSSKVYTCFGKVVVLVTQSTEKLGLQFLKFSTILYDFSKLQLKHIKGQDSILHKGPGNFLKFTTLPSALTLRHLQDCDLHTPALSGGAELAAGEVGPELANK
jgi:hypothetical protein